MTRNWPRTCRTGVARSGAPPVRGCGPGPASRTTTQEEERPVAHSSNGNARRRPTADQRQRNQHGRLALHRPAGRLAAFHHSGVESSTRRPSRTGSASTAPASAASSRSRNPTCSYPGCRRPLSSIRSRREPTLNLICDVARPAHPRAVQPRPALRGQEGRELPEVDRHGRHRLLRAGGGVLHLRRRPLRPERPLRLLLPRPRGRRLEHRHATKARTWATRSATRKATSRCRRWTTTRTCAPRWC